MPHVLKVDRDNMLGLMFGPEWQARQCKQWLDYLTEWSKLKLSELAEDSPIHIDGSFMKPSMLAKLAGRLTNKIACQSKQTTQVCI